MQLREGERKSGPTQLICAKPKLNTFRYAVIARSVKPYHEGVSVRSRDHVDKTGRKIGTGERYLFSRGPLPHYLRLWHVGAIMPHDSYPSPVALSSGVPLNSPAPRPSELRRHRVYRLAAKALTSLPSSSSSLGMTARSSVSGFRFLVKTPAYRKHPCPRQRP